MQDEVFSGWSQLNEGLRGQFKALALYSLPALSTHKAEKCLIVKLMQAPCSTTSLKELLEL
jgi:hypothetical protein